MDVKMKSGQVLTFEPRGNALANAIKAAKTDRERADALVAMSRYRISSGLIDTAKDAIDEAFELDPENPNVLHHYGLSQMRYNGILGGIEHYEKGRWHVANHREKYFRDFQYPAWTGQSLKGKKILLWAEQGIGDQIMHARSIPILQKMGAQVHLECDPRLNTLFQATFNDVTYHLQGKQLDESLNTLGFDYQCSLFSAWQWAKPTPHPTSYLKPDTGLKKHWQDAVKKHGGSFNIGISWSSAAKANGNLRSIKPVDLKPLLDVENTTFFSLQYGVSEAELSTLRKEQDVPIQTLPNLDTRNDMAGLAAAIDALDLVISIDNSTVHLSGALGVETWVMLPKSTEWRWGQDATRTDLYGELSLYRNNTVGTWQDIIAQVASDLRQHLNSAEDTNGKMMPTENAAKTKQPKQSVTINPTDGLPVKEFLKLFNAQKFQEAGKLEAKLSQIDLKRPNILFRLGVIYLHSGNINKADDFFQRTLELNPEHASATQNLGTICLDKMDYAKAEQYFLKSLEFDRNNANAYNNLGACCSYQGRPEEAKAHYLKALELAPERAQTFRNMTTHHKFESYDDLLVTLLVSLTNKNLSDDDRSQLCFAAFKAFDDLGERDRAFKYLSEGNSLFRSVIKYVPQTDVDNIEIIKRAFAPKVLPTIEQCISDTPLPHTPIFIIGMPRSGTSLTEQVLSSHSKVHGGGELPILNQIANPLLGKIYGNVTNAKLEAKHIEQFRKQYIRRCKDYPHDSAYMTDKMPANFRWVGFIKQALPEAKIINQIRDPRAICWSIYKLRFSTIGNGYAYDQEDLAAYYHNYVGLMNFWEQKYPGDIHNLNYESFTENQRAETEALLKHLGLDWEDACLEFHKSKRPVKTASSAQVKQELYRGSSEAWRKYEEFLHRGHAATQSGDFTTARDCALQVFEMDAGNLAALHIYFDSTKVALGDKVLDRLEKFCENETLPNTIRSQLHFMYGKALGDQKRYELAFNAFVTANTLSGKSSNPNATSALATALVKSAKQADLPSLEPTPPQMIFILGMPRSGTSIMAQSLDCHSQIQSLGENTGLGLALQKAGWTGLGLDGLQPFMDSLNAAKLTQIRSDYLATFDQSNSAPETVFVDKMPENYWFAWIIPFLFPNAQIIHMKRPPLANCWSCYRHDFADGHHYSYDFKTMLAQYAIYSKMTDQWRQMTPQNWSEVTLEGFVTDPKETLAPVLDALGLPWQEACLRPDKNAAKVTTLSKWQVRQGLDAKISDAWKNYQPYIKAMFLS